MRKAFLSLVMLTCLVLGMVSCKPSLPHDILSKGKMTDILYDYHLALAMAQVDGDDGKGIAYREAVLKKHGVTSAEFDSSMVYYMRHTTLLHDVYKDLADRMNNEVVALGGNGSRGEFDNLTSTGDTANVWNMGRSMVLSTFKPFNYSSFSLDADTAFQKGDCLMLDFDAQFIYQDGMRDGIALLAIQFKNDSVAQQVVHVQSSQHYSVQLTDNENIGIKSVKGYFLLSDGGFGTDMGSQTTLKLMFIDHIKLIRMHQKKMEKPQNIEHGDSAKMDSATRIGGPTQSAPTTIPSQAPTSVGVQPNLPSEGQAVSNKPIPLKARPSKLKPLKEPAGRLR